MFEICQLVQCHTPLLNLFETEVLFRKNSIIDNIDLIFLENNKLLEALFIANRTIYNKLIDNSNIYEKNTDLNDTLYNYYNRAREDCENVGIDAHHS